VLSPPSALDIGFASNHIQAPAGRPSDFSSDAQHGDSGSETLGFVATPIYRPWRFGALAIQEKKRFAQLMEEARDALDVPTS
jgi:hypothetical protein